MAKPTRDIAKMVSSEGTTLPNKKASVFGMLDINKAANKVYPSNYGGVRSISKKQS